MILLQIAPLVLLIGFFYFIMTMGNSTIEKLEEKLEKKENFTKTDTEYSLLKKYSVINYLREKLILWEITNVLFTGMFIFLVELFKAKLNCISPVFVHLFIYAPSGILLYITFSYYSIVNSAKLVSI